ncbi:SDR family NAD(P)-dependent oxidoreductase [Streptomyces rubrogriseus]|uniref:SDR family NAD(P)-dependent oxidoreductase n=1 Tax=Streptomyces rubrogriseus TaxID=194673 RepID=UPI0036FEBE70
MVAGGTGNHGTRRRLIALTKSFSAHFRSRRTGTIVNLSSISADQRYPYTSVYSASKAVVAALSEGLNLELAPFGISVKAVFPSSHKTKIFSKVDIASDIPEGYQADMARCFDTPQASFGSEPSVAANVVYQASRTVARKRCAITPAWTPRSCRGRSSCSGPNGAGRSSGL